MNEKKPLVSIALCTYNGEKYLKEQLDSLVNQTYPNIEIIAVDDCSTDSTLQILHNFKNRYGSIKIFENDNNLGYVKNFERAISFCSGELIALCDQDDIWDYKKIELQVKHIQGNHLIYHDSQFIDEAGNSMGLKMSDTVNFYRGDHPEVFLFFNCISGHSILFKRNLLEYMLPFNPEYFYDQWIAFVAASIGRVDFISMCLVKYRQHSENNTDILRLGKKLKHERIRSERKLRRDAIWLQQCSSLELSLKKNGITTNLSKLYSKRLYSYFSFSCFLLVFRNRRNLLFLKKATFLSKLNFLIKHLWGLKIKTLLNRRK